MSRLVVGLDFDNTIVSYHEVFHAIAVEQKLIQPSFPKDKRKICYYLKERKQENLWTKIQGLVYGKNMHRAKPFDGVFDFVKNLSSARVDIYIISHKTRFPYIGPKCNLHQAAWNWIEENNLVVSDTFFLETKDKKINKIRECQCDYFIDDLPKILLDDNFPKRTKKLLFLGDVSEIDDAFVEENILSFGSWDDIEKYILSDIS